MDQSHSHFTLSRMPQSEVEFKGNTVFVCIYRKNMHMITEVIV
jgi:hypothetical protein